MNLSVMTYNIRKSKGYRGVQPGPEQLGSYMASQRCDVVLCQEVRELTAQNTAHCCQIASELKMAHHYGANARYDKGSHGNATFSSLPVIESKNIDLSISMFEYRGALYSMMRISATQLCHFFNVHLGLTPWQRRKQLEMILSYINQHIPHEDAVVIAGDFNDFSGALRKQIDGLSEFQCAANALPLGASTWPSRKPRFQLDHIFYRHLKLINVDVLTQRQHLSDHLACRAEFETGE